MKAGRVTIDHLAKCLRWAGQSKESNLIRINFEHEQPVHEQIRDALTQNAVRVSDLFREFDENGDGEISMKEFSMALPMLGISIDDVQIKSLFDLFDADRGGTISFREFNKLLRRNVTVTAPPEGGAVGTPQL